MRGSLPKACSTWSIRPKRCAPAAAAREHRQSWRRCSRWTTPHGGLADGRSPDWMRTCRSAMRSRASSLASRACARNSRPCSPTTSASASSAATASCARPSIPSNSPYNSRAWASPIILLNVLSLNFAHGGAPAECARAYFALSGIIEFATLEKALEAIGSDDRWERRAAEDLGADLRNARLALCRAVLVESRRRARRSRARVAQWARAPVRYDGRGDERPADAAHGWLAGAGGCDSRADAPGRRRLWRRAGLRR